MGRAPRAARVARGERGVGVKRRAGRGSARLSADLRAAFAGAGRASRGLGRSAGEWCASRGTVGRPALARSVRVGAVDGAFAGLDEDVIGVRLQRARRGRRAERARGALGPRGGRMAPRGSMRAVGVARRVRGVDRRCHALPGRAAPVGRKAPRGCAWFLAPEGRTEGATRLDARDRRGSSRPRGGREAPRGSMRVIGVARCARAPEVGATGLTRKRRGSLRPRGGRTAPRCLGRVVRVARFARGVGARRHALRLGQPALDAESARSAASMWGRRASGPSRSRSASSARCSGPRRSRDQAGRSWVTKTRSSASSAA